MNQGVDHIKHWFHSSDIDYYMHFIRMWIPFNAWYVHTYGDYSDRELIEKLKNNSIIKDKIIDLLSRSNATDESIEFRKYLTKLHLELKNNSFPNRDNKISFEALDIGLNSINQITQQKGQSHYKITRYLSGNPLGRPNKSIDIEIFDRNNRTIFQESQNKYNVEELKNFRDFSKLTSIRKEDLLLFYKKINPRLIINYEELNPNIGFCIDEVHRQVYFINDLNIISEGIIEIIYLLRCKIFHGEMTPNENNKLIYRYAYNLLNIIVKKVI